MRFAIVICNISSDRASEDFLVKVNRFCRPNGNTPPRETEFLSRTGPNQGITFCEGASYTWGCTFVITRTTFKVKCSSVMKKCSFSISSSLFSHPDGLSSRCEFRKSLACPVGFYFSLKNDFNFSNKSFIFHN